MTRIGEQRPNHPACCIRNLQVNLAAKVCLADSSSKVEEISMPFAPGRRQSESGIENSLPDFFQNLMQANQKIRNGNVGSQILGGARGSRAVPGGSPGTLNGVAF